MWFLCSISADRFTGRSEPHSGSDIKNPEELLAILRQILGGARALQLSYG